MLALSGEVELGPSEKGKEGLLENLETWLVEATVDCLGGIKKAAKSAVQQQFDSKSRFSQEDPSGSPSE